jgi:cyanate permease
VIFGAVGVVWAAGFYAWFRDDPALHPAVNAAERAVIGVDSARFAAAGESLTIPWRNVLTAANVWLLGMIMGVYSILFYMLFQWYPTYLKEARGEGEIASGWLTGCVMVGGAAGCIAGGLMADAALRLTPSRKWVQRLCGAGALFLAAASVAGIRFMPGAWAVTLCAASAMFCVQMGIPTWWAVVAQISGRHGAAMWGLMNSLGGIAAMGTTSFIGRYVDHAQATGQSGLESWQRIFDGVAIALAIGAGCWMWVDSTRSAVDEVGD